MSASLGAEDRRSRLLRMVQDVNFNRLELLARDLSLWLIGNDAEVSDYKPKKCAIAGLAMIYCADCHPSSGSSPLTKNYNLCCERVGDSAASAPTGYKLRKLPTNLTLFVGG